MTNTGTMIYEGDTSKKLRVRKVQLAAGGWNAETDDGFDAYMFFPNHLFTFEEDGEDKTETLTRDEIAIIKNWYRWYLDSFGGKWANGADSDVMLKLERMAQ